MPALASDARALGWAANQ